MEMGLELRLEIVSEPAPERGKLPGWMLYEIGKGHWWAPKAGKAKPKMVEVWCEGIWIWAWASEEVC